MVPKFQCGLVGCFEQFMYGGHLLSSYDFLASCAILGPMIVVYFVCHQCIYVYTHMTHMCIHMQYGFCVLTAYVIGGFVSRPIEPRPYVCVHQFMHTHLHVQVYRQVVSMFLCMSSKVVHVF